VTETSAPFESEAGYRAAIALTLAGAQRELRVFDRDLTLMGLEERTHVDLLGRFLAVDRDRRLHVVVHDLTPLQSRLPRLLKVMRDNAQQVEIRVTPEHLRHLAECWLLADGSSGTIRFHVDHARGKVVAANPAEIKSWWLRANDLAAESEACVPWAVAGL